MSPTRGTAFDNKAYLKARYQERRAAGVCVDCPNDSPKFARCRDCRLAHNGSAYEAARTAHRSARRRQQRSAA